jgi:ABC-type sulfate/molybdate transport systems ATPase subunit
MDRPPGGRQDPNGRDVIVPAIKLERVTNFILKRVDLDIGQGELTVMIGPSGSGKTTLLNVIAGLAPYQGRVLFSGRSIDGLPPHRRRVGYVYPDLLLFPHLTVLKNLLVAMGRLDLNRRGKRSWAEEVLYLFRLEPLQDRLPRDLSGGEKQRAALARAIASKPKILLLDEPFASLDFRTARYLRQEFKRLKERLTLTTLFVTHNLHEARELADRIAVLRDGCMEAVDLPEKIWFSGDGESGFLEKPNLLACRNQVSLANGLVQVQWGEMKILAADEGHTYTHLAILPHDVFISPLPPPGPPINRFTGKVQEVREHEGTAQVTIQVGDESLRADTSHDQWSAMGLAPGHHVHGILKLRALHGI